MYPVVAQSFSGTPYSNTYFFSKCDNDRADYAMPISDTGNFGVYFDTDMFPYFDINTSMTVTVYNASVLPTILPAGFYAATSFFTEWIIGTKPNGATFFYGRGFNVGFAVPCRFYLSFVSTNATLIYTYNVFAIKNLTVGGVPCNCANFATVVLESEQKGSDCCGNYFGTPSSVIAASSASVTMSNKIEIPSIIKVLPPVVKVDLINGCEVRGNTLQKKILLYNYQVSPTNAENIACLLAGKNIRVNGKRYNYISGSLFDEVKISCYCNFQQTIELQECDCSSTFGCEIPTMCIDVKGTSITAGVATFADNTTVVVPVSTNLYYLSNNPLVSISPSHNDVFEFPDLHSNTCQKYVELMKIDSVTFLPCPATVVIRYYVNGIQQVKTLPANGSITYYYSETDNITYPAGVFPNGSWISIGASNFPITTDEAFGVVGNCFGLCRIKNTV